MIIPPDSMLGRFIGWIAVAIGILYVGLGFAYVLKKQGREAFDGLLVGGLAFAAGCVILHRREALAMNKQHDTGDAETDSDPGRR